MSVEQIKREITILTDTEQNEVTAFLFHLRHRNDAAYRDAVDARMNDQDKSHWLPLDAFERELDMH
ncbi:MAG: hypothetical protein ABL974_10215 [Prosthecobacter sp.]